MAKKTEDDLWEERNIARANAKARYDNVVKPAQESYKIAEQKARIILEQVTKPLWDNYPKEIFSKPDSFVRNGETYVEGVAFPGMPDNDSEIKQYQKVIDAAEDAYRKVIANAMLEYTTIENPAKAEMNAAIRLAQQQYNNAINELRKVDDWFAFRRTYQRSLRPTPKTELQPCTHEEIKAMKKIAKQVDEKDKLKCHFCGDSKARTEAGLNKVKYKLKHPGAGFWSTLLGRNWKYACQDCVSYMMHLWGPIKVEVIDKSVPEQTHFCRTGQHQMCGGFECECECHKHTELAKCPVCQGSGCISVLPFIQVKCIVCNGSGKRQRSK